MTTQDTQFKSDSEVRALFNISRKTLFRWRISGLIKFDRLKNGRIVFAEENIQNFLNGNKSKVSVRF